MKFALPCCIYFIYKTVVSFRNSFMRHIYLHLLKIKRKIEGKRRERRERETVDGERKGGRETIEAEMTR